MILHQLFFILSIVVGFITQLVGIYFIFKGSYKPQRTTRLLFNILNILFISSLIAQSSWDALGFALARSIGSATIFVLSFKYGIGGYQKMDIVTIILAVIATIIWKFTNDPTLALLMSILTSAIAFFPTLIKIYQQPFTENWKFYFTDVIASSFSLLSLQRLMIGDIAYPLYLFLLNFVSVIFIVIRQKQATKVAP